MVKGKSSKQQKATPVRRAGTTSKVQKTAKSAPRTAFKQTGVIEMLSRPQGVTIPTIMAKTGWQQHSVRGFFAGVVRKKLGLSLQTEKKEGKERIYRIVASKAQTSNDRPAKGTAARDATKVAQRSAGTRAH